MSKDMNRILIETTIKRMLNEIADSPERGIRNLIDLGLTFSKGRFQQNFLGLAQQMLRKEDSAYYTLLRDVLTNVDPEILTTFGINIGYNSCTKGAKTIRGIEAERGFDVPWALSVYVNEEKHLSEPHFYPELIQQGTQLGIFTNLIFAGSNPLLLTTLLSAQPDCAFLLFLESGQVTQELLETMKPVKNTMLVVRAGEGFLPACAKLRKAKMLYAAYKVYTQADKETILCGDWLTSVMGAKPAFAFLMADRTCPEETQQEIDAYALSVRAGQNHPVFLLEVKHDMLRIDKIISDDVCMVGFGEKGRLLTNEGIHEENQFNIFQHSLESILNGRMRVRK